MLKISGFHTLKGYNSKSIYDEKVLFFANDSKNPSQSLYFFTVHKLKLIWINNLPIYLLGTNAKPHSLSTVYCMYLFRSCADAAAPVWWDSNQLLAALTPHCLQFCGSHHAVETQVTWCKVLPSNSSLDNLINNLTHCQIQHISSVSLLNSSEFQHM